MTETSNIKGETKSASTHPNTGMNNGMFSGTIVTRIMGKE